MATVIFFISFIAIFYAYFGYALTLFFLKVLRPRTAPLQATQLCSERSLSVIITVRNEQRVIRQKLEETLQLRFASLSVEEALKNPDSGLEVIVASDASDDETDDIVRSFADRGVMLVRTTERGGKERAQKAAVEASRGAVIVFTDAKIKLNAEALNNFLTYFSQEEVGAVSSVDNVQTEEGVENSGEGAYVRYEMWLRSLESDVNTLVGLSGSCFGVRREVASNLAVDIPSDFALLIEARKLGLRGVHAPDIIGTYQAVKTEEEEFSRKVRTVLRGMSALFSRAEVMNPKVYGLFALQVISHKLMRWLVPWFIVSGSISCLSLFGRSQLWNSLGVLLVFFYLAAARGFLFRSARKNLAIKIPLFFLVTNAAVGVAWVKYMGGTRSTQWNPSEKGSASNELVSGTREEK